jgi:hypothetical protein
MDFALVFVVRRFLYRIEDFFHHWYVHGIRRIAHGFIEYLSQLDQTFALKVTIRYFFQPLYKDYSIVGRILGIVFRSGRILIGGVLYGVVGVIFLAVVVLWAAIPIVVLLYSVKQFFAGA